MERLTIAMIRAVLSFVCGTLLMRLFYPDKGFLFAAGLGLLLFGLAYLSEAWRRRRAKKQ
ncbi:MAG: hypothetical protein MI742_04905 [Desulfobacterales bacterium]|nr:hypothetical protein [Desulfobacterales bacterium]